MKIGFIGCGNMARAMIGGIQSAKIVDPEEIFASAAGETTRELIRSELKISCASNRTIAETCDLLFLAVKPYLYEAVITEIRDFVKADAVIVTLAPGLTLAHIQEMFGGGRKIVRTMPNTPAMVCEGMTAVCANEEVSSEDLSRVLLVLRSFGKAEMIPEKLMDAVTGAAGSSPAYVFLFIEAMADGAVAEGMPRDAAYRFAAQAVLGSAKMVLETGLHPGELKDMVCSPGGTTIRAVQVLEEKGMRSAVMNAVRAAAEACRGKN